MRVSATVLKLQPRMLVMIAVMWGILGLPEPGRCTVDEQSRVFLRGLLGVEVVVAFTTPTVERDGLTHQQILTDVELRLRQAGIIVLTRDERLMVPGAPYLDVQVSTYLHSAGFFTFCIEVHLRYEAYVEHLNVSVYASTWSIGVLGAVGTDGGQYISTIRRNVKDRVDFFINDYLSVNPRPAGRAAPSSASPRRDLVRQAQERLQSAGFSPGAIDGTLGPQTRDALRGFQNAKGLRVTGELDEATLDTLGIR